MAKKPPNNWLKMPNSGHKYNFILNEIHHKKLQYERGVTVQFTDFYFFENDLSGNILAGEDDACAKQTKG